MAFHVPGLAKQDRIDNRIGLLDTDCVAYWAAAGCDDMPVAAVYRKVRDRIEGICDQIQTDDIRCYLTGPNNFRDLIATYQTYKGNRYDRDGKRTKPQPKWLKEARQFIMEQFNGILCEGQEADDALAMAQVEINASQDSHSIISSIDKDLRIVPGLHHDMNSGYVEEITKLGYLKLDDKKKLRGGGLKFFYAQLLMGDSADWIPGLPKVTPWMKETFNGIKRLGGCGAMSAYHVLHDAEDEYACFSRVLDCYASYWDGEHFYINWRTNHKTFPTATDMLIEQGRLLWMRQSKGELWMPPDGFLERWIKERDTNAKQED